MKNLNSLLKYKSSDKVLYSICELLGFGDINILKFYLSKVHKMDSNGNPIFLYKEVMNEQTGEMETVYDYEGYPDYDTHEETYRELGITRSSYEAAAHRYCIALEPGINQKTMETLAGIVEQERRLSLSELPGKLRETALPAGLKV